jgi:hypothetical protein
MRPRRAAGSVRPELLRAFEQRDEPALLMRTGLAEHAFHMERAELKRTLASSAVSFRVRPDASAAASFASAEDKSNNDRSRGKSGALTETAIDVTITMTAAPEKMSWAAALNGKTWITMGGRSGVAAIGMERDRERPAAAVDIAAFRNSLARASGGASPPCAVESKICD